jgi:CrcB protein
VLFFHCDVPQTGSYFDSFQQSDYDLGDAICQRASAIAKALDVRRPGGAGVIWWRSMVAVALGGTVGCLVRWLLSLALNRYFPLIPPGTLAANLIGGYIIGAAFAMFTLNPAMPVEWRLFVMTGFCGGLTTFSTFSVEVVLLMQNGRLPWAMATIAAHLVGSLLMTLAGIATVTWARS